MEPQGPIICDRERDAVEDVEDSVDDEVVPPEPEPVNLPLSLKVLVDLLSHYPQAILDISVQASKPIEPVSLQREIKWSSLGDLDKLPVEILHIILLEADIRSVARMAQVSVRGRQLVEGLPQYQQLMEHAGAALGALGATSLAAQHKLEALHAALHTANVCIACGDKALFLFMPTLERCCLKCLIWDSTLHCMPTHLAREAFDLSNEQVSSLPTLHTLGEHAYPINATRNLKSRLHLVSMKAAKILGKSSYTKGLDRYLAKNPPTRPQLKASPGLREFWKDELTMLKAHHFPSKSWTTTDFFRHLTWYVDVDDDYCGMSAVDFPELLADGTRRQLYCCRGCLLALQVCDNKRVYRGALRRWLGEHRDAESLINSAYRAYYIGGFVEHLLGCKGARQRITDLLGKELSIDKRNTVGEEMIRDAVETQRQT